jgi:cytochrome c-type biogenesis protein CcmF
MQVAMNGEDRGILKSSKRQHFGKQGNMFEPSTEVGIIYTARQDVYLVLSGVTPDQLASIHINFNPLVMWVWMGGALMLVGGMIVMWPKTDGAPRQTGYNAALRPEHDKQTSTV